MSNEKIFRSKVLKNFSKDLLVDLYRISELNNIDTNTKCKGIQNILNDYGVQYAKLGPGTNRYAVLVDGYAMKIALDRIGRIDNMREFRYTKKLFPRVVKGYEISGEGLILSTEYVAVFSLDDFYRFEPEMREILEEVCEVYYVADIGLDPKNYANWGIRNGNKVVILDYAYIYALKFNNFRCNCGGVLGHNRTYTGLICPLCKKSYSFFDIRRRISREQEMKEIGDLTELGYIQDIPVKKHIIDPTKTEIVHDKKKKESKEKIIKNKKKNFNNNISASNQKLLIDEMFDKLKRGEFQ